MPNELWQKMKPWVVQGALLLGIGLLFWFGIRPLHGFIRTEMDEIQKLDVLREHKSRQMQRLPELEKQNALIEEQGRTLEIVLTKEEIVEFIRTLERLAEETGVKIEIASKDNTLLESKITLPLPGAGAKNQKAAAPTEDGVTETIAPPTPQPKRGAKQQTTGMLNELSLKHYIRLTLTVKAPYKSLVAYLHKLETMPYAVEIIGVTMKEAEKEREETITSPDGSVAPVATPQSVVLSTEFDMLVYTKE